eukprot:4176054-Pyramimonas_sp.AAC.1
MAWVFLYISRPVQLWAARGAGSALGPLCLGDGRAALLCVTSAPHVLSHRPACSGARSCQSQPHS